MATFLLYDALPYPSKFFLQTHPDSLASIAVLYGLEKPPIENCRYLELGCGNGSNVISHAFNLPGAEFVGVDLAENHIAQAQESARELNLSNATFHHLDVMKMSVEEFGAFDYIVAHGLYSWVPPIVREKVLSLCREMLAPDGIGYLSFNVYPGAYLRDMTRNMMRFHTRDVSAPIEKVERAVSFLAFLTENTDAAKIYRPILQSELERHSKHAPADILHDDLSDAYQSFFFHEFAAALENHDLRFLSEAELHSMSAHNLSPEAREFLETFDDVTQREQYLDFLRGRVFRQTLFCHRAASPRRQVKPSMLNKLSLASSIRPQSTAFDPATSKVEKFVGEKNLGIEIDHSLTKAVLFHLGENWAQATSLPKLLETAKRTLEERGYQDENWEAQFDVTRTILLQICLNTNLIELHLHQPKGGAKVSEMPEINRLARWQLRYGSNVTTLLNKDIKIDDAISRKLLELLDGTRNQADLQREMIEFIKTDDSGKNKQEILDNLPNWLGESLTELARIGIFAA